MRSGAARRERVNNLHREIKTGPGRFPNPGSAVAQQNDRRGQSHAGGARLGSDEWTKSWAQTKLDR